MFVYDITSYESFANLGDWVALAQAAGPTRTPPLAVLVANKSAS